jgi:hypothetical protein
MTLNPLYASYGLTAVQGVTGFINAGTSAKLAAALQKYRNQMLQITRAMNDRAISQNEIRTRDASVRFAFAIEERAAVDQASAEVSAAAAGVQGMSVDRQMRGLRGSALRAHSARKERTRQEMAGHANERINNNVSTIMQRDITVQEKPSLMFHVAGLAKNLFEDREEAKTPSQRKASGGTLLDFFN